MKISDVIKQISSMVDTTPLDRSSGDNTSKFTAFTGDLIPVEAPAEEAEVLRKPGKMPSGNDKIPDDLYLPPLQLKSELLKKAVDVENVFSDGTPAVRYDEEYGEEGWQGDPDEHNYVGDPQTAERVSSEESEQPDPNEELTDPYSSRDSGTDSDSERKRSDESLYRILELANVKEAKQHWDKDMYDADAASKKDKKGSIVKRRKDAVAEGWDDFDDFDSDVEKADRELSRLGRAPIKAAVIDLDKDELECDDDWDDEQLDEISDELFTRAYNKRYDQAVDQLDKVPYDPSKLHALDKMVALKHKRNNPDWVGKDDEQLDELSKDTLKSYHDKAGKDADKSWGLANAAAQRSNKGRKSDMDQFMKHSERFGKRKAGMDRATDRLTADECSMNESHHTMDSFRRTLDLMTVIAESDDESSQKRKEWRQGGMWDDVDDESLDAIIGDQRRKGAKPSSASKPATNDSDDFDECSMNEAEELNRVKELAGLNAVVLDELSDDYPI